MEFARKKTDKSLVSWLSLLGVLQLISPAAAVAANAPSGAPPAAAKPLSNLILTSASHSISAGSLQNFKPAVITAGGHSQTITKTSNLTPAQALAVLQVVNTGHQSLILSASGSATGGSAVLHQGIASISGMAIPHGVSVADILHGNTLNVSGNLSNAGALLLLGNSNALSVNASSISNLSGGLISTRAGTSLVLNATHSITNAGTISSGNNLTLNAGQAINNSTAGLLQAANNVNLKSGTGIFANQGNIIASNGNINISSGAASGALTMNALGGTLQALQGSINFGNPLSTSTGDLTLNGGNYLSQNLNLNTGAGTVDGSVDNVTGVVNVNAGCAHFSANAEELNLGVWNVSGDPLIENTGNIDIAATAALSGTEYVILAGGSIVSSSSTFIINTSSASGAGGNVVLGAGVNFTGTTIKGASKTGGDIELGNVLGDVAFTGNATAGSATVSTTNTAGLTVGTPVTGAGIPSNTVITAIVANKSITLSNAATITNNAVAFADNVGAINTSSSKLNSPGGNVTLLAFANPGNSSLGGHVVVGGAINTAGDGTAAKALNGNVTVVAGGLSSAATPLTVSLGSINTGAYSFLTGLGGSGAVAISTSVPNTAAKAIVVSSTGLITPSAVLGGAAVTGAVSVNSITTGGAAVSINAGTNANAIASPAISVGAITTNSSNSSGGAVTLSTNGVTNANINVTGNIATTSLKPGASGGSVIINSTTGVSAQTIDTGDLSSQTFSNAGSISISAGNSANNANVSFNSLWTSGVAGGYIQVTSSGNISSLGGTQNSSGINNIGTDNLNSSSQTGAAGNIFLAAGALTTPGAAQTTLTSGSIAGGGIALSTATTSANSSVVAVGSGANAGNITLLAYGGSSAGSGYVTLAGDALSRASSGGGVSGNVLVLAGATSVVGNTTTISMQNVSTNSGTQGGGGNVTANTAQPGTNVVLNQSGTITSGSLTGGANVNGVVSLLAITTTGANVIKTSTVGGNVSISSGQNASAGPLFPALSVGSITTSAPSSGFANPDSGGSISLTSGVLGGTSANQDISVSGTITSQGNQLGAAGGAVKIVAGSNLTVPAIDTTGKNNAAGGSVLMVAGTASNSGSITFTTVNSTGDSGGAVQMLASSNISSTTPTAINTSGNSAASNGNGGNVLLLAGGVATVGTSSTSVAGSSGFGGNVSLTGGSAGTDSIKTSFVGTNGSGGSVTLVAFADSPAKTARGNVQITGDIDTNSKVTGTPYKFTANQNEPGTNYVGGSGNILVVAEQKSTAGSISINLGNLMTDGNINSTGGVTLVTASPNVSGANPLVTGNSSGAVLSGSLLGGSYQTGAISVTSIVTNGGNVQLMAGNGSLATNAINVPGGINTSADLSNVSSDTKGGSGGLVTLMAGLTGSPVNANIVVGGTIKTVGITLSPGASIPIEGTSGAVSILTPASISVNNIDAGDVASGQPAGSNLGSNGGLVTLVAGSVATAGSITFANITSIGGSNNSNVTPQGNGGTVSLISMSPGSAGAANISGASITTDSYSTITGFGGSVAISTATGTITVGTISTQGQGSGASSGNVFLSTGDALNNVITTSINTSTINSNNQGSAYVFINNATGKNFSGTSTIGSTQVTGVNTSGLAVGMLASGAGFLGGTTIVSIDITNSIIQVSNPSTGGGLVTFNAGSTFNDTIGFTSIGNSTISPGIYASASNAAFPSLNNASLTFAPGNPSTVSATNNSVPVPNFFSPGGFSGINQNLTGTFSINSDQNKLVVPIVALGNGAINLTGSFGNGNAPLLFVGSSITLGGSFAGVNANPNIGVISAVSPGAINISNATATSNPRVNIGLIVTPSSASIAIPGNLQLFEPIIASSVTLNASEGSTPGFGNGGSVQYFTNNNQGFAPPQIVTNNLSLQANTQVGLSTQPLIVNGAGDGINLNNTQAQVISLVFNGNAYLNTLLGSSISTNNVFFNGAVTPTNVNGNLFLITESSSANQGSITVAQSVSAPQGYLALIAAGGISTSGLNVSITATGRDGVGNHQTDGNRIYLLAGTNAFVQHNDILIQGRSGNGGNIDLPGLSALFASTDLASKGGAITVVAYSNTKAGLIGGKINLPSNLTIGTYSPDGTSLQFQQLSGVSIVGEASGGPTSATTISTGGVYGGTGSIEIVAAQIDSVSEVNPNLINVDNGKIDPGGAANVINVFFTSHIQANSSIVSGDLDILGQDNSIGQIGTSVQGINIAAGGAITTGNVRSIGATGATPQPVSAGGLPQNLNGFRGGSGGSISISSSSENVTINGSVLSFGGGGGGGLGAPFTTEGGITDQGHVGGTGGNGGGGGSISINGQAVTITGAINASGGGGGGGGGGYGGFDNVTITSSTGRSGGPGGAGGDAGSINLSAGSAPGSTIVVGGSVIAIGGGNGGGGGTGESLVNGHGGSGGGGGGSFGAGGGGGGAGVSEPLGNQDIHSGLGGAGGGGLLSGGGGDIQNVGLSNGTQSYTGFGGFGGGAYLPNFGQGGVYAPGAGGGSNYVNGTTILQNSSQPGNLNGTGGSGGTYNATSGEGPPLDPGPYFPAAIGGKIGFGGAGGASAGSTISPSPAGVAGGNVAQGAINLQGRDGNVTMQAYSFTTPSTLLAGGISLTASTNTGAGSTNGSGDLIISGSVTATGNSNSAINPTFSDQAIFVLVDPSATALQPTTGNLIILPSTTINSYGYNGRGVILLENNNPTGLITIGANSQIFARTNGTSITDPGLQISMGTPTWQSNVAPVVGHTPADVTLISSTNKVPPGNIAYGTAGITAIGAKNIIYALGAELNLVAFQSGFNDGTTTFGNSKSITLGGGVQIGATSKPQLSSLDLSDTSAQGTLNTIKNSDDSIPNTFTYNTISQQLLGGSLTLYPINLIGNLSAFNIINPVILGAKPVTVTMSNFTALDPINVNISGISSTKNVVINSPLTINGIAPPTVIFNVNSDLAPTFGLNINATNGAVSVAKGSITTTGNLAINVDGGIVVNGALSASAGMIALATTAANGSINVTSNITASKGFTASANGTGQFTMTTGKLSAGGTGVTIEAASFQLGAVATKAFITDTAGFSLSAIGSGGITVNTGSTISANLGMFDSYVGSLTSGSNVLTVNNTNGLLVGEMISGAGIPAGASIVSIIPNTSVTISANVSATTSNETLTTPWVSAGPVLLNGTVTSSAGAFALQTPTGISNSVTIGAAISAPKGITINSAGSIVNTAALTSSAGQVSLSTNVGSGNAVTVKANITGGKGVSIYSDGVFSQALGTITATNSTLSIQTPTATSSALSIAGKLSAGTGTVILAPASPTQTILVSTVPISADFNVSPANLNSITAGTVQIGTAADSGGIQVTTGLNVSGTGTVSNPKTGTFNLVFDQSPISSSGSFSALGQVITLGTKNLTVNVGAGADPGNVVGGISVNINAGSINLSALVTPSVKGTLALSTTNASLSGSTASGNIVLNSGLPAVLPATVVLNAGGATGTLSVVSATYNGVSNLTLGGANITGPISTNAKILSINSVNSVTINDTATALSLGTSTVGGTFSLTDATKGAIITTSGVVSAGVLSITSGNGAATPGSIMIASSVTGTTSATLTASGTGTITSTAGKGAISAGTLTLASGTGTIGSAASNIVAAASNLSANTNNSVFITDNSRVAVTSATGTTFNLTDTAADQGVNSAISVTNPIAATTVVLNANNATSGSISLGAGVTTPATGTITLTSAGAGGITQSSGVLSAKTLTVTSGSGGVNLPSAANLAPTLAVNSNGAVFVRDDSSAISLGASSAGSSFTLQNGLVSGTNTLTVTGAVTAQSITLQENGAGSTGNVILNGTLAGVGGLSAITINATGALTQSAGTKILGFGALTLGVAGTVGTAAIPLGTAVTSTAGTAGGAAATGWFQTNAIKGTMNLAVLTSGQLTETSSGGLTGTAAGLNITLRTTGTNASIGTAATALQTSFSGGTGTLTLGSTGSSLINVANITATTLTLPTVSSGGAFSLSNQSTLNLTGVSTHAPSTSTTAGNITIRTSSGAINVNGNVTATGGGIIIQDTDTTNGNITFKPAITVSTLITGAGKQNPAQVQIAIDNAGLIPQLNSGQAHFPASIKLTGTGNSLLGNAVAFAGTTPASIHGPGSGTASVQGIGSDVVFDVSGAGAITLGTGTTIKADPVVASPSLTLNVIGAKSNLSQVLNSQSQAQVQTQITGNVNQSSANRPNNYSGIKTNGLSFVQYTNPTGSIVTSQNVMTQSASNAAQNAALANLLPAQIGNESGFDPENIVLFNGANIRAIGSSSTSLNLGAKPHSSSFKPVALETILEAPKSNHQLASLAGNDFRAAGLDAQIVDSSRMALNRGSVLVAPKEDTVVQTPFGDVSVAADSVVLVVATRDAVSVYNFHDTYAGAVSASVGDNQISLAPGRHLSLTTRQAPYENINPLTCITHRGMSTSQVAAGMQAYSSEFSIMSAVTGLRTWNELRHSNDRRDSQLMVKVLKDAAIIQSTRSASGAYQTFRSADKTDKVASAVLP